MDADARRALESAVGRAWMVAEGGTRSLRRAGMHFVRAGDARAVSRAFGAWAVRLRRQGDHRPAHALAAEFLGREDPIDVQRLVRTLPFAHRYSWARWRAAVTIVFVAAASAAGTWQWTRPSVPPADERLLVVTVDSSGDTATYGVPIRRDRWPAGDLMIPSREGRRVRTALPSTLGDYAVTEDGKAWISHAAMPDSGGDDLMLEHMAGGRKRLTWSRGDDVGADLSPDGKRLVFVTGRFDSLSHVHVAVMDLATGRVHQLTSGLPKDASPKWSPDGLRIAFGRVSLTDASDSLCTIAPDGEQQRCTATTVTTQVLGWIDDNRVLVTRQMDSLTTLDALDIRDGTSRRIFRTASGAFAASPDGRWIACMCRESSASHFESIVFPIDHPEFVRTVAESPLDTRAVWVLWPEGRPADYVKTVGLSLPAPGLQLSVAYRLPLVGITARGHSVSLPYSTMHSLDTGIVRVLPGARLLPVATGRARIVVSASGWRTDTITVPVVPVHDSIVMRDDWSRGIGRDFVPFGVPTPVVVKDTTGRSAFWNHGDGDYSSGVFTRTAFRATGGLGLETTVSIPVSMIQWQSESLALMPVRDSTALARWDHETGYLPTEIGMADGACNFEYPTTEGTRSARTAFAAQMAQDVDSLPVKPLGTGRWFRVRVQIFSDGRCGVAIDGHPIALSTVGPLPNTPYMGVIDGSSVHTRVLTGPIEIWTGIRPGVDWLAFDTAQARRR